ncbi:MAG: transposase [Pseudonocardiaceae bacterium]
MTTWRSWTNIPAPATLLPSSGSCSRRASHLASWAGLCPGNHESAGKRQHGTRRKGNQHIKPVLVEAAWSAVRTDGRLHARYHHLVLRFGGYRNPTAKKKAIVAPAHTLIVVI